MKSGKCPMKCCGWYPITEKHDKSGSCGSKMLEARSKSSRRVQKKWALKNHPTIGLQRKSSTIGFGRCTCLFYPYGSVSKPCTPGEHQNSWKMDVHPTKNGINRYWSIAICGWGLPYSNCWKLLDSFWMVKRQCYSRDHRYSTLFGIQDDQWFVTMLEEVWVGQRIGVPKKLQE